MFNGVGYVMYYCSWLLSLLPFSFKKTNIFLMKSYAQQSVCVQNNKELMNVVMWVFLTLFLNKLLRLLLQTCSCLTLFTWQYLWLLNAVKNSVSVMNSSTCGFLLLIGCCSFFAYYTLWVIVSPFYPPLAGLFPSARYALIIPAFSGTVFIGSLILYTIWALKTQWLAFRWEPDFTFIA